MSIKLAVLRSGETIIADTKELISEDNVCGYLFEDPHVVQQRQKILLVENSQEDNEESEIEVSMQPWIIMSKDKKIPVRPDWVVTIVEPIDIIREMYEEKVNGKNDQGSVTE